MKTLVIQIGNSDDKLSQAEWAMFCEDVNAAVKARSQHVHFSGGSPWNAPWQNACWVCVIDEFDSAGLLSVLTTIRAAYQQDSVAVITGETQFI